MRTDPRFLPLLEGIDLEGFNLDGAIVVGMWPDFTIAYLNGGFERTAERYSDEGFIERWGLGASALDAITEPFKSYYRRIYTEALTSDHETVVTYECHNPELFRHFQLRLLRLGDGAGLLAVHTLAHATPHAPAPHPDHTLYTANGVATQCGHCRRVRRADDPTRWDFIPGFIRRFPGVVSHGICDLCLKFYFP